MANFRAKLTDVGLDFGTTYNQSRWLDFCKKFEGSWVTITKDEPKRSLSQNSFYWLYLDVISQETGNDANDLHFFFRQQFLPLKIIKIKGKKNTHEFKRLGSTTELTKSDFGEYLDKISAMTGVPIPDPALAGFIK